MRFCASARLYVFLALMAVPGRDARAAALATDADPWLTALASAYVIMDMSTGDLDGDGLEETVVCYREDVGRTEQKSGIAILAGRAPDRRPVFHVQLEVLCEKARVQERKLGILIEGDKQLVWTYGEDVKFRSHRGSIQSQVIGRASSWMDSQHKAEKALDGDLSTSWAEGVAGTGLGQTLTLRFPRPMNVGAVAIFPGASGTRAYFDNNRVHRASIEAKTEADMGDAVAGVDFAALGIQSIGDRQEFSCENKPQVAYVNVNEKDVVELNVRIESVYLGDRRDDTHIAEIEVIPLLSLRETLDKARPTKVTAETQAVP